MSIADIERINLDAHVSLCELRYLELHRRMTQIEGQLESLQILLSQIRDSLSQLPQQQNSRWDRLQTGVIGALVGLVAWLASRAF